MLCRPVPCAHRGCSDVNPTYASPSRRATKLWCSCSRSSSRPSFRTSNSGRRHAFKNQVAAHAIQEVPFGGSFYNLVHWCAWTEGVLGEVRLQVSCDVVYTNKWVPARGVITSSSTEGMTEYYNMWLQQLHDHLKSH